MTKFKLNKKYNHKANIISEAIHIDNKRADFIVDQVGIYWDTLLPEKFMISKILDFIEQQDWTIIEKLYATERFASIYYEEMTFGDYNEELINYIIKTWKEKGTVYDDRETQEYLKHMFKLLSVYNLECLINTLKDINSITDKFGEINPKNKNNEVVMTPEQMEEQRRNILINHAIQSIDQVIPDSFGVAVFCKTGYNIIAKSPETAKLIQDTLTSGQKNFIVDKEANLSYYQ